MSLSDAIPGCNVPAPPALPKDHWAECDASQPAHKYRAALNEVARKLSEVGPVQYTRFKRNTGTVEILSDRNGLLASIFIFKGGSQDEAMVGLKEGVDEGMFRQELPLALQFFPLTV